MVWSTLNPRTQDIGAFIARIGFLAAKKLPKKRFTVF